MAQPKKRIRLRDDSELTLYTMSPPLDPVVQSELVGLLEAEFRRGDVHWGEAMRGDYAESLQFVVCPGQRNGQWVGTATTAFSVRAPEVGVVCDVVTHPDHRRLGIAKELTEAAMEAFLETGGRALYLGTHRDGEAWRVYERLGFSWFHGVVMRHLPKGSENFDDQYFATGQSTSIRSVEWGDLPAVSALFTRPYDALAGDYSRGILSARYTHQPRCVSVFPAIVYDGNDKGGSCEVLVGEGPHRVLGLASFTPIDTATRRHVGTLEILAHENYQADGPRLLRATVKAGKARGISQGVAYVPVTDTRKAYWVRALPASPVGVLHGHVETNDGAVDVEVFEFTS